MTNPILNLFILTPTSVLRRYTDETEHELRKNDPRYFNAPFSISQQQMVEAAAAEVAARFRDSATSEAPPQLDYEAQVAAESIVSCQSPDTFVQVIKENIFEKALALVISDDENSISGTAPTVDEQA